VKETTAGVSVSILGKDFMIACPREEREALRAAAAYLDKAMRDIHSGGKVIGSERTAIMAALNIANELLELRARGGLSPQATERVRDMTARVEAALRPDAPSRQ
jgi:cell division protein ZapA